MDPRLRFLFDPEVPAAPGDGGETSDPATGDKVTETVTTDPAKTEAVQTPAASEPADPNKATIPVQGPDGKIYNVTPTEANTLLQMGLNSHFDGMKEPEVDDSKTDLEKLQEEFNSFRQSVQAKDQQTTTNQILHQKIQSSAAKEDSTLAELASSLALAKHIINPRIDLSTHFDDSLRQLTDRDKTVTDRADEKILANSKVRASLEGISRGDGGVPVLDSDKKWSADDVKTGASRKALAELLEAARVGD